MSDTDIEYLRRRAEIELNAAERASNPKAVAAHYQLAEAYLERTTSSATEGASGQAS